MPPLPSIPGPWQKLVNLLQLARLGLAFTAISGSWLTVFLFAAVGPHPAPSTRALAAILGLCAVVSAGLHTYGMALNDLLDARHDRLFYPQRPIPAGGVGPTAAVILAVLCLLLAVLAALYLGQVAVLFCIVTAVAILFFNAAGKFLPAVGILTLGVIRALNMLLPAPDLSYLWPIWLTGTHVMVCWAIAYQLEGKRPRLHAAGWWFLAAGWAFWTILLWQVMKHRGALAVAAAHPGLWAGPVAALVLFVLASLWLLRGRTRPRDRRAAGSAFARLAMLWLIVYDASWLASLGRWGPAALLLSLLAAAVLSSRILQALDQFAGPAPTYRLRAGV